MFDRWLNIRYRRLSAALILGCSVASGVAPTAAAIVLQPGDAMVSSNETGNAALARKGRIADQAATGQSHWSWLLIAALIGLAPLAIERVHRKYSSRRRYSRMDIAMLETELDELKAQDRRHRAILDPLNSLSDGIEINDSEGCQLYSNAKYSDFFPEPSELRLDGTRPIHPSTTDAAHDGPASSKLTAQEVRLPDGRSVSIRRFENRSGASVLLYTDTSDHETVSPEAQADGGTVLDRSSPPPPVAANDRQLRVLLAEDNAGYQKIIRDFLTRAGHIVVTVENGELAVAEVQRTSYDVVLIDFQMTGMGGVTAAQAIRRLDGDAAKVPIIALTSDSTLAGEDEYRAMGADGYVSKPIEAVELFGAIGQCCGSELEPTLS